MPNELKMYCVVSREALNKMGGNRGKLGAQTGHAFLHAYWDAMDRFPESCAAYKNRQRAYKITLVAETTDELQILYNYHKDKAGIELVTDAAFTVFDEPTITCLGVGPIDPDLRSDQMKRLKPLI